MSTEDDDEITPPKRKKRPPKLELHSDGEDKGEKTSRKVKSGKKSNQKRPAKRPPKVSWRRFLLKESIPIFLGIILGLGTTSLILWSRAHHDVQAFLANPPRHPLAIVWSAPLEIKAGYTLDVDQLIADLLAAGYEQVTTPNRGDQFTVKDRNGESARLVIHSEEATIPGYSLEKTTVTIQITDGQITETKPKRAVIKPIPLATFGDRETDRTIVKLSKLSSWLEPAVLAMEDQRFRQHIGVDPFGIARAIWYNFRNDTHHGGSTLTQQLAKNLFLTKERTLHRKVREVFFAAALEQELGKDQVLEMYLSEIYLGQAGGVPIYGVEQASRAWFGISASNLSLAEAATIAGIISSPNSYSPLRHPERAKERRILALDRMVEMRFISADDAEAAKAEVVAIDGALPGAKRQAPWAVDHAIELAEATLGEGSLVRDGLQLYTTIQPLVQHAAEIAVQGGMKELETDYPKAEGAQAALVAVSPADGAVLALVGGRNYVKSPFNRATDAEREIGSLVKPFTVLTAFDRDPTLTPLFRLEDAPITRMVDGKSWSPENYDGKFRGEVTLRHALESSLNIPMILLAEQVGFSTLQRSYRKAGLSSATAYPSAALGAFPATPLQVAGAYTVFPGGGTVHSPRLLRAITDSEGVVVVNFETEWTEIATSRASFFATELLSGVVDHGTATRVRALGITGDVAGKTGTTNDYRDAWFAGFTPELVAVVWVGRDRGEGIGLSGSRAALPTWARFIHELPSSKQRFSAPKGVIEASVCTESEWMARDSCPNTRKEWFPADAIPETQCEIHGGFGNKVKNFFENLFGGDKKDEKEAKEKKKEKKPPAEDPKSKKLSPDSEKKKEKKPVKESDKNKKKPTEKH